MAEPFKFDHYTDLVKVEISGRPFFRVVFGVNGPGPISVGGVSFLYQFPFIWWAVIPLGQDETITISVPFIDRSGDDPPPRHDISLDLLSYPDTTPGALEDELANHADGSLPSGTRFYGIANAFDTDFAYEGIVWKINGGGGVTDQAIFEDGNFVLHHFDPPINPIIT